jgi:Domain of unknown function (DUF3291)
MTAHLAQVNISRARGPLDGPLLRDFVDLLAAMNALADASPGFVWRLKSDDGNAISGFDDPLIVVNLSVWTGVDALFAYAYSSSHRFALRQRRAWFEPPDGPSLALWWIEAGSTVTLDEARRRLEHLRLHGPGPHAFTFKARFDPPAG